MKDSSKTKQNFIEELSVLKQKIQKLEKVEKALRASEDNFRRFLDDSPLGVRIVAEEGETIYANQAILDFYGYDSIEELKTTPVEKRYTKESFAEYQIRREKRKLGVDSPSEYEISIIRKNSEILHLQVYRKIILWNGEMQYQAIYQDITEHKQVAETLRESEERFRSVVEKSSVGIAIVDDTYRCTYVNKECCNISGYSEQELVGINFTSLLAEESKMLAIERYQRRQRGEDVPSQYEFIFVQKNGEKRTGEVRSNVYLDSSGKVNSLIQVIDITERKQAADDLRESEIKYRLLTEKMSDIAWIADMNLKMTYISPSIKNVLGFSQEERLRQKLDEQLTPHSLSFVLESLSRELALEEQGNVDPNRTLKMELEYYHKDGSTRWMELVISGIRNDQGVLTRIHGVSRDITDRKRAEEALRESEELYRTIFETTGTSTILIEEDTTISMANEEFVRNSEYSPDEINGRMKWTEIVHPDDLGRMVEQHQLRRTSQGGALPNYEFRYITKTGKVMDTFLTIKLVPGTKRSIASLMNITDRKKAEEKLKQTLESLRKAVGATIQVLVSAVESRDSYTAGHQSRSANLACAIATEMGLAQEKIEGIRMAGIIHDIGKLSIPAEILSKPTRLTEIEFALIKEHSRSGYEMLKDVESPWPLAEIVYQHHERMNGSGYPRNLKGDEIIMESQILAVADVVEAMASHRPYRPTLGIEAALEEITKNKGILYNNAIADACLRLFREKGYQLT